MRFMIIDTSEIILNNHTCEIIDSISGGKIIQKLIETQIKSVP